MHIIRKKMMAFYAHNAKRTTRSQVSKKRNRLAGAVVLKQTKILDKTTTRLAYLHKVSIPTPPLMSYLQNLHQSKIF